MFWSAWYFRAFSTESKANPDGQSSWVTEMYTPGTTLDLHTCSGSWAAEWGSGIVFSNYESLYCWCFLSRPPLPRLASEMHVRKSKALQKRVLFLAFEFQKFRPKKKKEPMS